MRTFTCDCGNPIHFENHTCLQCGRAVGFDPRRGELRPLSPADRHCAHFDRWQVCNWLVTDPGEELCEACGMNEMVPYLGDPRRVKLWYEVEKAKRRLLFSLHALGLPVEGRRERPDGLAFRILSDARLDGDRATAIVDEPVVTGHHAGTITINLMEAAPHLREQMREAMDEPYRTVLGHFRHESGHYFWRRLVESGGEESLAAFRRLFGDERTDYAASLGRHYETGPPADWETRHVAPYAASHPLEDFAESWAHYLHMVDTLETAADARLGALGHTFADPATDPEAGFDAAVEGWLALTSVMNRLNRSMGLADAYPFSLAPAVREKLRFVHRLIVAAASPRRRAAAP